MNTCRKVTHVERVQVQAKVLKDGSKRYYMHAYCATCRNAQNRAPEGSWTHYNRLKRACPRGHPYEGDNLRIYTHRKHDGTAYDVRACRECVRLRAARYRAKMRAR